MPVLSKNLGMTDNKRWHVLNPGVRESWDGMRKALCGAVVFPLNDSREAPYNLMAAAHDAHTPRCARCYAAAERKGVIRH